MPELPDLEVLRERLESLIGDTISEVEILFPLTFRVLIEGTPQSVLLHQPVQRITRRGKLLIFELDSLFLVMNLMLTGRLQLTSAPDTSRYPVVIIHFESGTALKIMDYKKMGKIYITDDLKRVPQYTKLGVEPLSEEFSVEVLSRILTDSRPVKVVLTDQSKIAGIGNAYVDEILFHAKINPRRRADSMNPEEIVYLYDSILTVLNNGIKNLSERAGDMSEEVRDFLLVHGKKGQRCPTCGAQIKEIEVSRRVTHVCPSCQKVTLPW
ncbi:MAG: Fpg/Nei family DNA glycosylase [Theionarchaea archaeon]|nr:Fpg/Nei family DNA glycosylase [Theionarchaea archaeon]MBU7001108.1 Fpg/Nei family DNA glycosylase [Theionarchaea archaeon]MBU7020597.1 Fpg/Nei family DNA glycosylase [Theionarchaea archaeon]MBU7034246.1 Fpg/Nei family DNA glycosylase [Theionarchaea archaeon]MBU7039320.1 Fpg/Nei family DNA glycosylase [Theionarchaea archaeon]